MAILLRLQAAKRWPPSTRSLSDSMSISGECNNDGAATLEHWSLELSTNLREVSQCPEKTPTTNKAISFLKAPAIAFTIKNLKTAKLERQHKNHNWRAELRIFANQGAFSVHCEIREGSLTALTESPERRPQPTERKEYLVSCSCSTHTGQG